MQRPDHLKPLWIALILGALVILGFAAGYAVSSTTTSADTTTQIVLPFRQVIVQGEHTTTQTFLAPSTTPICPTTIEPGVQYVTPCINRIVTTTLPVTQPSPFNTTTTEATTTTH